MKFHKSLYSKIALVKAAYNYTDRAYVHLDADETYYYVTFLHKNENQSVSEEEFMNEMLAQSVRHLIYNNTKHIRELLLARAMSSTLIADPQAMDINQNFKGNFSEDEILKDWFETHETDNI